MVKITVLNTFKHRFLKPMFLKLMYNKEDNVWCVINEELALYGSGSNYVSALLDLDIEIEGHIISFTTYPDEKHTQESLVIKNKLLEYINFTN